MASKIDIESIRNSLGLSRQEFVRRVGPHLRNFHLNDRILRNIENGTIENNDRADEIHAVLVREFGAEIEPGMKKSSKAKFNFSWKWAALFLSFMAVAAVSVAFLTIEDDGFLDRIERLLGAFATIATIATFIVGLKVWQSRK